MNIRIQIDAWTRWVAFRRTLHPMHAGDLDEVERLFDQMVVEVHNWFVMAREQAVPD